MADLARLDLVRNDGQELSYGTAAASQTIDFGVADEKLIIVVSNPEATTARVRVSAGDGISSSLGSHYEDVAQNKIFVFGPYSSSRFKNMSTGKLTVTIKGTDDGTYGGTVGNIKIKPILLP